MASLLKRVKMNCFVLKWKRFVNVLSPLASKFCGGSHIVASKTRPRNEAIVSSST